jgi:hypothetical protein
MILVDLIEKDQGFPWSLVEQEFKVEKITQLFRPVFLYVRP